MRAALKKIIRAGRLFSAHSARNVLLFNCVFLLLTAACAAPEAPSASNTQTAASVSVSIPTEDCPEDQSTLEICAQGHLLPSDTPLPQLGLEAENPIAPGANPALTPAAPSLAVTPSPSATSAPLPGRCLDDLCSYSGPLFLRRPIDPPANDVADATYRFGSTQSGVRDPHHGVEFLNGFGTPVLAAADGLVAVAGTDVDPISPHGAWPILFYGLYSNFYGNLVVIEHPLPDAIQAEFPDLAGPLYTLYGHLSEISVQPGQQVQAGQQIGKVGMAGIATGSHLHFEVRLGENSYKASHNPELWLAPRPDESGQLMGALAGRFIDSFGNSQEMPDIVLQRLPEGADGPSDFKVTVLTYEEMVLIGQPPFGESFGAGDLPAGLYRLSFPMGGLRQEIVQVYPGQLTVGTFRAQ